MINNFNNDLALVPQSSTLITSSNSSVGATSSVQGDGISSTGYTSDILQMAYGNGSSQNKLTGIEYRMQRLERGQKVLRRGRISVSVPQFKSQSFVSQTTANNPFVANSISGSNFPPGSVPDLVAPTNNNSNIRQPRSVDEL